MSSWVRIKHISLGVVNNITLGIVDRVGPNVKNIHVGQRVVTSFQIACGDCSFCKQKLSSFCDRTNNSS
jgi:Zn-dependent alcohol dehydrogenase